MENDLPDKTRELESRGTRFVRLVFQGRLLSDDNARLADCGITDGCAIHCVVAEKFVKDMKHNTSPGSKGSSSLASSPETHHRGFGVLLEMGLNEAEIEVLRLTYFQAVIDWAREHGRLPAEDRTSTLSHSDLQALEEEWIEVQLADQNSELGLNIDQRRRRRQRSQVPSETLFMPGAQSLAARRGQAARDFARASASPRTEAALPGASSRRRQGTAAELILGVMMGFFFGIITLLWIWDDGISKRMKLGVICGILLNIFLHASDPAPPPRQRKQNGDSATESGVESGSIGSTNLRGASAGANSTKLSPKIVGGYVPVKSLMSEAKPQPLTLKNVVIG